MRSRKIIKKILQITALLLILMFAMPAAAFLLLQNTNIQTGVVNKVMQVVSRNLQTRFTIGKIDISFLYRVRLKDVYLEDLSGDTLLYARSITVGIRQVNPFHREVSIGSIDLDRAFIGLAIDSSKNLNIQYFIDKLMSGNSGKGGAWKVLFNNVRMRDGRFALKNYYSQPVDYGINFSDLRLSGINAFVKHFNPSPDSLSFDIKSFQFTEQSGFRLEKLNGKFSESKTFICLRELGLETPYSNVKADEISLRFRNFGQFKADSFARSVKLRLNLDQTRLDFYDLGFFARSLRNTRQVLTISGQIKGSVSNLKGKNLEIGFGSLSVIKGELNLEGLPDIKNTFIVADIKQLTTWSNDLKSLNLPGQRKLKIPEQLNKLGKVTYKGKFTGFTSDFVAFGKFTTNLGSVNTDLLFRPDTANYIDFEGKLHAADFEIGKLLNASDNLGKISLSVTINGANSMGKSINANLKGVIQKLEFKNYNYSNITVSGNLKNKTYNGSVNIKDPNVELEFLGNVNLSDSIAAFDFKANVTDANLYALHLGKSDPDFTASFYLIARGTGNSINTLNGEIKLLNSLFTRKDKQLQIYDFTVRAVNLEGSNHLELRSDFADADLTGNYDLTEMNKSFRHLLNYYLPALIDSGSSDVTDVHNSFTLKANFKNVKPLFTFFLPAYFVADKSTLQCSYNADKKSLDLNFQSPQLFARGVTWNGLALSVISNKDSLKLEAGGRNVSMGSKLSLDNFTVTTNTAGDSSDIHVRWNNWQDLQYKGNLRAMARISRPAGQKYPHIGIDLFQASVVSSDSLWTISPGQITIDSSRIHVTELQISHRDQYFKLGGTVSEIPDEKISLLFDHFNLGNLNGITSSSRFQFGGILNGSASVSNIYHNPLFTSKMHIDSLMINKEILGSTEINSSWDDRRKMVIVDAHTMRNNLKTIAISGNYTPSGEGKLDFDLVLDKLRMNIFNPYVSSIFNDLRGIASGKATLSGSLSKPVINGLINFQKSAFTVNYLKTRYNFTEKIKIEDNNFYFDKVRVYDTKGNSAYLSGIIRNKYLKNFYFDMNIRSDNFFCLNTGPADNGMYYGTAYGKDVVLKISGPPRNLTMDISATTGSNTSIKIPLSNEGKLNEYNFITVIEKDTSETSEITEKNYQVNLSGLQINFDLNVTPDAEVQIIFDPKLGDIIQGRGTGSLNMIINTTGNFQMFGDFTIEEGNYLFTAKNLINRKFIVEPGGIIRWTGDPINASVNIMASYSTKAAMSDLYPNLYPAASSEASKVNVEDRLTLSGKLMSPEIKYDIYLPNATEDTRLQVSSATSSGDELNKQFLSLLIMSRFVPAAGAGQSSGSGASPYSNAAGVNASEFLSNQLSHWLSQISNDVDVGVKYRSNRSATSMKSDEVQVALSTQLFNDRLTINGSVDVATNASVNASNNIVGEFDVDYKITKNGKFRIKTFNHANNELLYETPYTQGLGVTYKEEFNTAGELWRRYWRALTGTRKKEANIPAPEEKPGKGG
jgi:hypothetical protein